MYVCAFGTFENTGYLKKWTTKGCLLETVIKPRCGISVDACSACVSQTTVQTPIH